MPDYSSTIPFAPGHYVYRLWDASRACLYVGAAGATGKAVPVTERLRRHAREQEWSADVATVDCAAFTSPAQAAAEERAQIKALQPRHNKTMRVCRAGLHDVTVLGSQTADGKCRECTNARMRTYQQQWRAANPGQDARYQARQRERLGDAEWKRRHREWSRASRQRSAGHLHSLPAETAKDAKSANAGNVGTVAKSANAASPGDVDTVGTVGGPRPSGCGSTSN